MKHYSIESGTAGNRDMIEFSVNTADAIRLAASLLNQLQRGEEPISVVFQATVKEVEEGAS